MSDWQPIETARPNETILTQHVDDLFPVPAFYVVGSDGGWFWMRETEGPEDTFDRRKGKMEPLYRPPTHWMPLPEPPK